MQVARALFHHVRFLFVALPLCLEVGTACPSEQSNLREEIGYVSQMAGSWIDRKSGLLLRVSDRIYLDSALERDRDPTENDHIEIRFHGVDKPVPYDCKSGIQCRNALEPRGAWEKERNNLSTAKRSFWGMLSLIVGWLAKDDPHWIVTMSPPQRGPKGRIYRPLGLATLENGTLTLEDLLEPYGGRSTLPEPLDKKDVLEVELCPVTDNGVVQCPESPTGLYALAWGEHAPQHIATPKLQPGLYLLIVCYRKDAEITIRSGVRALVLAVPKDRVAPAREEWTTIQHAVSEGAKDNLEQQSEYLMAGLVSLRRAWLR
ncbi:MAG: hypothetical protein HYZ50_17720 [Deltaproteobacteria bacterium]|nr:hypothetical protein [Deltaproteobacteria bacterium]